MARAILIFDGECGFCTTVANHLKAKSIQDFEIVAWQLTDLAKFQLTTDKTSKEVYLILDGQRYAGAKAVARSLTVMRPIIYRTVGHLLLIPPFSWLAIPGYLLVAKFRHKLPGGTPACKL